MIYSKLIEKALDQVRHFYENEVSKSYVYHSFIHTLSVLESSHTIGKAEGLSDLEMELVSLAAIFHDTGHAQGAKGHENRSMQNALDFLKMTNFTVEDIGRISDAILSTKVPQNPKSVLSKVLCDADLMYLASDDFVRIANLLLQEWKLTGRSHISTRKFYELSVDFLSQHDYHTNYGKAELQNKKEKNLKKLDLLLKEM